MTNQQPFPLQPKQYPPSESELLLASIERGWRDFVALCIRLPAMDDFSPEPAISTSMDRMTLHVSGTGLMEHKFNGQTRREKSFPGSVCILPRGTPSAWRLAHPTTVLHFYFFPSLLASIAPDTCDAGSGSLELRYLFNGHDALIEQIGRAILSELQTGGALSHLYAESLIHTLAIHLLRHYSAHPPLPTTRALPLVGLNSRQLRQVKDHIHEHLGDDHSVIELSATLGLSPSYFSRQFKHATSLSPHQYLIQCRVERAKSLLNEGRLTIAETARQVGFADQSHLTRHFHRAFGVSPGAVGQNGRNVQKEGGIVQDGGG